MKRRPFLVGLTGLAGLLAVDANPFGARQLDAADIAPLVDQLKAGLKARKPSEHLFIERVGQLVGNASFQYRWFWVFFHMPVRNTRATHSPTFSKR